MRWIYISPHFDDAVLSCGGLIWEQAGSAMPVEIWTICAGDAPAGPLSPFAERLHAEWRSGSATETLALRRVEDRAAARRVGAVAHHFSIPDCIYRLAKNGEFLYAEDVFVPIHPSEQDSLVDEIAVMLKDRLTPQDTVVSPLALGHIDHALTRAAAERLNRPLLYYGDVPYLFNSPDRLLAQSAGMTDTVFSVTEDGLLSWQEGIAAYASQISSLFPSVEGMYEKIANYWQACKGVRLWQPD
jgi:LmbE family N-acetylglucosaminyl deacetylase